MSDRFRVVPSVYLIPLRQGKTVLGKRQNTPWMNGWYGLISGHVEEGETPEESLIREAYEEAGIVLDPSRLKLSCMMYRQVDRTNVDFFYVCEDWQGEIHNGEPDKCEGWEWHDLNNLPPQTIEYLKLALNHAGQGRPLELLHYEAER